MTEDHESIDRLIEQFQAGIEREREEAFRHLYQRFHTPVRRFFKRKGFSEEESLDLAQETFLQVYRTLDTLREESKFKSWLFSVAMNVYHKALRLRSTQKRGALEVSLDSWEVGKESSMGMVIAEAESGPLTWMIEKEQSDALLLALQELPDQMRMCCFLRIRNGMEYREIAQVLGISINTVKSHLHQARQRLRAKLGETEAGFGRL